MFPSLQYIRITYFIALTNDHVYHISEFSNQTFLPCKSVFMCVSVCLSMCMHGFMCVSTVIRQGQSTYPGYLGHFVSELFG